MIELQWAWDGTRNGYFQLLAVTVLCVCVGMQMLGVPVTLWDPQFDADNVVSSILEDFSIPETSLSTIGMVQYSAIHQSSHILQLPTLAYSLFHPPVSA